MVRRGAYDGQAGGEIDAVREGQGLERGQALVVVHGQGGVKAAVVPQAEEAVGGVGAKGLDAFLLGLQHGRKDDVLLLVAQQAAVSAVGVQAQDGNLGIRDAEVPLQGGLHDAELPEDAFLGKTGGNVPQGDVARHHANLDLAAHHDHGHVVGPEFPLEEFGVAGVGEALRVHGAFVDGGGHQHVYLPVLEVLHGHLQGLDGSLGAVRGALAGLCVDVVRQAVHQVDFFLFGIGRRGDDIDIHGADVVKRLAIEAHELRGTVDDGGEGVQDAFIGQ